MERRQFLQGVLGLTTVFELPPVSNVQSTQAGPESLQIGGKSVAISVTPVSEHTFRLTISPVVTAHETNLEIDGSLVENFSQAPAFKAEQLFPERVITLSEAIRVRVSPAPLSLQITGEHGQTVQHITVDPQTAAISFNLADGPVFGLGEGGKQFDRRGTRDEMRNGQEGYRLLTYGSRVPVPWLIGSDGWAAFFHQPYGTFDLSAAEGKFVADDPASSLPLDVFFVVSKNPATIMREYARLTGLPAMPPLWSFGYQQSHRTLASTEEILAEAQTFREKKLPCDTMIYLGTGFCPSGWNTANGSFDWNERVFPQPKEIIGKLHQDNFRVALHAVILSRHLRGSASNSCELARFDEQQAGCYWDAHRKVFDLGVDGWWPDEGDPLDAASRLCRNRMYWEGPQLDRPNERPFALHRNGYAGMQRYGSFLWSGDVSSTWETLQTHLPVALNTGLTGIPYWGTDIGGFVPTKELTAELYLRWFQFGAFCPLFRSHGRAWKLRLPWGWNTGEIGPAEMNDPAAVLPDASRLHNPDVERICRKYLELRYRLLPYLYSVVRESSQTGMPIMRALWLHYPEDPLAVARSDEYLWGPNMLVAPVVEKGATERAVYLPRGDWHDFWTGEHLAGGREIKRSVDLETMPLYVRAGSILPIGPIRQHVGEKVDEPVALTIYPGADGSFPLYEDDGRSFDYHRGAWMGIDIQWRDAGRTLSLALANGSSMLLPVPRRFKVILNKTEQMIEFAGHLVYIKLHA